MRAPDSTLDAARPPASSDELLRNVRLLALLPEGVRTVVTAAFQPVEFAFGEVIVREGDEADSMFVITSGRARVITTDESGEEVPLASFGPGEAFGESAALDGGVRSATVRASEPVTALRLDAGLLRALARTHPAVTEALELDFMRNRLDVLFQRFPSFAQLSTDLLAELLRSVRPIHVDGGDEVVREGESGGALYVVESGRLRAHHDGRNLAFYRAGDLFGERALFTGEARAATVEALEDADLLQLGAEAFEHLLAADETFRAAISERIAQYDYKRLARVPLDFADELLPAEARTAADTGLDDGDDEEPDTARASEGPLTAKPDPGVGPFADAQGRFVKRGRRIRRWHMAYQVDEADCGAACTVMVARHFGRRITLSKAREVCGTNTEGSSLAGIVRGATELGLAARSVKASKSNLDALPLPAAIHWKGNHWVIIYDVAGDRVRVADPGAGLRRHPREAVLDAWSGYAALFEPTADFARHDDASGRFAWLRPFVRPFLRSMGVTVALAALVSVLQMAVPVLTQVVVDRVLVEANRGLLNLIVLGLVGVVVVQAAASLIQGTLLARSAAKLDRSTLEFMSSHLLALPMRYFNARRAADIRRRLRGFTELRRFLVGNAVGSLTSSLRLVASLGLMLYYDLLLTAVFLAIVPCYVVLMRVSSRRIMPLFDGVEEAAARYDARQADTVHGIETVKVSAAEDGLGSRLLRDFAQFSTKAVTTDEAVLRYSAGIGVLQMVSLATLLWVGALRVLDGAITVGEFVSFNALVALATGPIFFLLNLWDDWQQAKITLTRLEDVFEEPPEPSGEGYRQVCSLEGRVTLDHVSFQYAGPHGPKVLDDICLDVAAGTTVAIVGRSGSGKTTLARLLAGLELPTLGTIRFDGVDMATLDLRALRRHIGVVLQETYLFADSIAANIALGDLEPDMERVEWAARVASAHAFIRRLPLGYETNVGESGVRLSGGQRQRVSIARALYPRPAVLILDEATSALDTESERAVQSNMDRLLEGRTSFVIAHRLSTIRSADRILVLDDGRLVEQGDHDELLARRGLYFHLHSQQLGG